MELAPAFALHWQGRTTHTLVLEVDGTVITRFHQGGAQARVDARTRAVLTSSLTVPQTLVDETADLRPWPADRMSSMCMTCVAQGVMYTGGAVIALRGMAWSPRRAAHVRVGGAIGNGTDRSTAPTLAAEQRDERVLDPRPASTIPTSSSMGSAPPTT